MMRLKVFPSSFTPLLLVGYFLSHSAAGTTPVGIYWVQVQAGGSKVVQKLVLHLALQHQF